MPIEFACPECKRGYRVKGELAGKTAKCGKCGHRMRIPALEAAVAAPVKASPISPASQRPVAKAPQSTAPPTKSSASWLDEELESSQPKVASAPSTPSASCPACGASLAAGAVLCVACGYDTRTRARHETKHVVDDSQKAAPGKKRGKLAGAASLLRGTLFSFIAAIIGAAIWTAIAAATGKEFSLVAWGLGGLVGFGMALGHDDEDGTFAGIIAAFMSLFGIVAAKVFIIVFVIAPAIAALFAEMEDGEFDDPVQAQAADVDGDGESEPLDDVPDEAAEVVAADGEAADQDAVEPGEEEPGLVRLLFASMFSPVDGIFILLAFFTAYGVGSGQMTD
jgi:hypothetical protein